MKYRNRAFHGGPDSAAVFILAQWFGLERAPAAILWNLWLHDQLHGERLRQLSGVATNASMQALLSRLRLEVPIPYGEDESYHLDHSAREKVTTALKAALAELASLVDDPTRQGLK